MPLVNSKEMFQKAYEGGYAIGAFNVNDMELLQGIMYEVPSKKDEVSGVVITRATVTEGAEPTYLPRAEGLLLDGEPKALNA